jgi:hypothetical protein
MAPDDVSRREAERLRGLPEAARVTKTFEILAGTGALWVWGDEDETLFTEDARRTTWLPQLKDDDAGIAVFPVEERNAAVLTLDEFRSRMTGMLRLN